MTEFEIKVLRDNYNEENKSQKQRKEEEKRKIAEDYYIKHYQKKMVDKFIRDFRVKVGIAMANECYGQDGECPYFVLAKEIVKPFNDR